jgi:hypothetical protein
MGVTRWGQLDYLAAVGGERAAGRDARRGGPGPPPPPSATASASSGARAAAGPWTGRRWPSRAPSATRSWTASPSSATSWAATGRRSSSAGRGRVPRFRTAQADELRAFLLERGYVVDEEPLAPEQIRIMLAAEAGDVSAADALVERLGRGAARTDLVSPAPAPRPPGREGGG